MTGTESRKGNMLLPDGIGYPTGEERIFLESRAEFLGLALRKKFRRSRLLAFLTQGGERR